MRGESHDKRTDEVDPRASCDASRNTTLAHDTVREERAEQAADSEHGGHGRESHWPQPKAWSQKCMIILDRLARQRLERKVQLAEMIAVWLLVRSKATRV